MPKKSGTPFDPDAAALERRLVPIGFAEVSTGFFLRVSTITSLRHGEDGRAVLYALEGTQPLECESDAQLESVLDRIRHAQAMEAAEAFEITNRTDPDFLIEARKAYHRLCKAGFTHASRLELEVDTAVDAALDRAGLDP